MGTPDTRSTSDVKELLFAISALIAGMGGAEASAGQADAARAAMASCIACVASAQQRSPFVFTNVHGDVLDFEVRHARLPASGSLDVLLDVRTSGQPGALVLSMGASIVNLGAANSYMTLEVGGALGAQSFTFTSGTTLADVTSALNSHSALTGVRAVAGESGIGLRSKTLGPDSFVRVRVVHAGGIEGERVGIYRTKSDDAFTPDPTTWVPFLVGVQPVDFGQEPQVRVNGRAAEVEGSVVRQQNPALKVEMQLEQMRLMRIGEIRVMTVQRGH